MNQYDLYKKEDKNIREDWFKNHIPEFIDYGNLIKIKWREPGTWNMAIVYYIDCKMGYLMVAGDLGEAIYQWSPPIGINFLGGCDLSYFDSKCQASSCGERGKTWNSEVAEAQVREIFNERRFQDGDEEGFYAGLWEDLDWTGEEELQTAMKVKDLELYKLTAAYWTDKETWPQLEQNPDYHEDIEQQTPGYMTIKYWSKLSKEEQERFKILAQEYIDALELSGKWKKFAVNDSRRKHIEMRSKFDNEIDSAIGACQSEFEWHRWLYDSGHDFLGDEYYEYGTIGRTISRRVQSHLIGLQMIREGLASGKFSIPIPATSQPIQAIPPSQKISKCPWQRLITWIQKWF